MVFVSVVRAGDADKGSPNGSISVTASRSWNKHQDRGWFGDGEVFEAADGAQRVREGGGAVPTTRWKGEKWGSRRGKQTPLMLLIRGARPAQTRCVHSNLLKHLIACLCYYFLILWRCNLDWIIGGLRSCARQNDAVSLWIILLGTYLPT